MRRKWVPEKWFLGCAGGGRWWLTTGEPQLIAEYPGPKRRRSAAHL